jgi:hypothetical protein
MHHYIVRLTFILLVVAWLLAVAWCISSPDFEPALTSVALVATITGLFIDRWLTVKERRQELLFSLDHELCLNYHVLSDSLFQADVEPRNVPNVYPRLYTAILETIIASGAFVEHRDRRLFQLMHLWRQRASEFNHRLDITELRTFMNPTAVELRAFRAALTTRGPILGETQQALQALSSHLRENYSKESGINRETRQIGALEAERREG